MLSSKQRAGRIFRRLISLALLVAAASAGNSAHAQNLVPNPGFESYLTCPTTDFQFDGYVANWKNPTVGGSPDYFNACNKELCSQGVPAARYGFQSPRDSANGGNAFAGIYNTNIGVNYREYVSVRLTESLERGKWYNVRFYASLAEASPVGIMNLGAFIGRDPATVNNYVYPASPQISYRQFLTESGKWVEISGMYQATGGENHLIIGCFDKDLRTTPSPAKGAACADVRYAGAYYYIDDVSLTPAPAPACFTSSEYYDVTFKPAGISADGECCWSVSVASKKGACPLYGINAFLPSGTTPFTWRTETPVMPEETRAIGEICLSGVGPDDSIYVTYLDRSSAPMSFAARALRCGTDASSLAVRAIPFDAGSADFCSFDLFVDNLDSTGAPLEALTLRIDGAFEEGAGVEWSLSKEGAIDRLHWEASSGSAIVPARGTLHVGRFSVAQSAGPGGLTASLYQHPAAESSEPTVVKELSINCTMATGTCYETLHAGLLQNGDGTESGSGCYIVNVHRDENATCEVASITLTNATPDITADWQPYQLPTPLDLTGVGRDVGVICFDPLNPPVLNITYHDASGAPICTKRLATDPVKGREKIASGVPGIDPRGNATLAIAPNPARGMTTIGYNAEGAIKLELFAMTGELVETIAVADAARGEGTLSFDASHLPPGIYRMRMISTGATSLATLVVTR